MAKQPKNLAVAIRPFQANQLGQFNQLIVGAGSTIFKANREGVFAGAVNYTTAPFKLSYTGALVATSATITGTINATAGVISGDLTVTGSLLSGNIANDYQLKMVEGRLAFLYNSVEKAFIRTEETGSKDSLILGTGHYVYTTMVNGTPLVRFDQSGNIAMNSTTSIISWGLDETSALRLTGDGNIVRCSGSLLATSHFTRVGSTDYEGDGGTFKWMDGATEKTARVRKGLITNLNE